MRLTHSLRLTEQGEDPQLETDEGRRRYLALLLLLFRRDVEILAQRLVEGAISLADWELAMARLVKNLHIASAAIAYGGEWGAVAPGTLEPAIAEQYEYLHGFAEDIRAKHEAGEPLTTAIHARAKLYAEAGWALYWLITREIKAREGATETRLITMGDERVCDLCLDEEAKGWMPIGDMKGQMHLGCRCWWEFR